MLRVEMRRVCTRRRIIIAFIFFSLDTLCRFGGKLSTRLLLLQIFRTVEIFGASLIWLPTRNAT